MITIDEVKRATGYAKLDVSADIEKLTDELNAMIDAMGLDLLADFPAEPYPLDLSLVNTYREDVILPSLSREAVLANAPERAVEAGCITVPKMGMGG